MKDKKTKECKELRQKRIKETENGRSLRTRVVKDNKKYDRSKENSRWKKDI